MLETIASPGLWAAFIGFVIAMLALDLGVFHRHAHAVKMREAAAWSCVWVALALLFNLWVGYQFGSDRAVEFLSGYLIEKALAVDNIFVFLVLFSSFAVPTEHQHRVLFWGVLGALVMRAIFIFAGAALLARFHWVMYLFGAFLVLTGVRLLVQEEKEPHPEQNPLFRLLTRWIPSVPTYHGSHFFIRAQGRWLATPLLLVLLCVEFTDAVFAIDSIPAIFAVTRDPFIVFTSNIFAILGLRSMFFLLAGSLDRFHYLKTGLALVLAFVGGKMLLMDLVKVPLSVSLAVIVGILASAIVASRLRPKTPLHLQTN